MLHLLNPAPTAKFKHSATLSPRRDCVILGVARLTIRRWAPAVAFPTGIMALTPAGVDDSQVD
jgi:hypothetical protein